MTLHERFFDLARTTPDAVAVVDGDRTLSYGELAARALALRDRLAGAGIGPGRLVGLRMPRCAEVAVGIVGILAAGCAYVPLDPAYPEQRRRYIAGDARLPATVRLAPGTDDPEVVVGPGAAAPWDLPSDIAYVIYTSGSTGSPKGVLVGHRQVEALMDAGAAFYGMGPDDVWPLFHSHGFDVSVWELWGALLHGGTAVVVPRETAADPRAFAELLVAEGATMLNQVPTAFGYLLAELEERPRRLPDLRYVIFAGEAVNLTAVRRWHELGPAPGATVVNMYGTTETTVHVTTRVLPPGTVAARPGTTPVGVPLPHLGIRLVDEELRPVPDGTPGEILITGAGVAHGYLGRPELTARRFVAHDGERAYRSGDWGVRDEAGDLHYIGRRDRQIQLRGFRVELGEPETAITGHPDVAECAVTVGANRHGEPMLVAHYVVRGAATVTPDDLRGHLTGVLPAYMVPTVFVQHAAMPTTDNGKVDLDALSALTEPAVSVAE